MAEAESNKVFSPVLIGAGLLFAQSKLNCTSVGAIGAVGVTAKQKTLRRSSSSNICRCVRIADDSVSGRIGGLVGEGGGVEMFVIGAIPQSIAVPGPGIDDGGKRC